MKKPFSGGVSPSRPSCFFHYFHDITLLAALTIGFFWRLFFTADAWMPADGGDLASFLYPTYSFAARTLKSGVLPLWNPTLYGGMPFAADIQSGFLYPPHLLVFLLTPTLSYRTLEMLAVFHFWLAGVAMYSCLRGLIPEKPTRLSALFGAVAFMFSDLFITHFGNLNLIAVAAWLPFVFLGYHRAVQSRQLRPAMWGGLALGLATLAGHIQITLFIILLVIFYAVWETSRLWLERKPPQFPGLHLYRSTHFPLYRFLQQLAFPLFAAILLFVVAVGLAAVVLVPAYEMAGHTARATLSYEEASAYSLAPAQLIGLLVPGFFGRGPALYWGLWDRVEAGYLGILPLMLAFIGLVLRRDRLMGFFVVLAVISLFLALGGYSVIHGWFYALAPGFKQLRAPARFILLLDFALAALAALGLEAVSHPLPDHLARRFRRFTLIAPWLLGAVALATVPWAYASLLRAQTRDIVIFRRVSTAVNGLAMALLWAVAGIAVLWLARDGDKVRRVRLVGALAVALAFLDLAAAGAYIDVGNRDPTSAFHHPEIMTFLRADPELYRIDSRTGIEEIWQPDTAALYGLQDVGGIYNPSALADYERYWAGLGSRSSRLYDLLNAKYLIARKDAVLDWSKFAPVFEGAQLNIYLNRKALPRAFLVHQAIAVPDAETAWEAIHAPDFEPAEAVIVQGGPALETTPSGSEALSIVQYSVNEIELKADVSAEAYLVLSEVWYPGWQAVVDGRRQPVVRANYLFRAVRLEPGQHRVRLIFRPWTWWLGALVSLAIVAGLLFGVCWRQRRK